MLHYGTLGDEIFTKILDHFYHENFLIYSIMHYFIIITSRYTFNFSNTMILVFQTARLQALL